MTSKITQPIQAIRGMNDILPSEVFLWQWAEHFLREILQSYSYQEIRLPIVEKTELFKRSIGEVTDIVEKEMYTFLDRNDESLTLRPEGTAVCVRAAIQHGLLYNQIQRLWYLGPYFRYERPQKGRSRQFFQCGVEIFGLEGPDIDAELIQLSATIFERLGLRSVISLQLNSLGSLQSRIDYRQVLVDYLIKNKEQLDEDSHRRLMTNPLRILDSKNPAMKDLIAHAPKLINYLDKDSENHFQKLQDYLTALHIPFSINPCLVRGLDYYTKTVFEWVTHELGAQGTICAGGRYDGLVEQLGGKSTPGLGFAMGMERTILLLQHIHPQLKPRALDIYFITEGDKAFSQGLEFAATLRDRIPGVCILQHCGGGSLKNQFKKADKSGALFALVIGEKELQTNMISLKFLREDKPQALFEQNKLLDFLITVLKSNNPKFAS